MKFHPPASFKVYRALISLSFVLVLALLIVVASVLTWIAIEPRSLRTFIPVIESALSPAQAGYKTKIDEAYLVWDGWEQPMDIRLRNVEIRTPDGQIFASFPQVSMGLDIISLLMGKVTPHSLVIQHPVLSLYQQPDKSISFGFENTAAVNSPVEGEPSSEPTSSAAPLAALLGEFLKQDGSGQFSQLDYIAIREADMSIGNKVQGVFFAADHCNLSLTRGHNVFRVSFGLDMTYGDTKSSIKGELKRKRGVDLFEGRVELRNILPSALARFFMDDATFHGVEVPVSAVALLQMKVDGTPLNVRFAFNGGNGVIAHPRLEEALHIGSIESEGSFDFASRQLVMSRIVMQIEGASVNLNGSAVLVPGQESIIGTGVMTGAKSEDIHKYWPVGVSPLSREWVTSNITGGVIPQATIKLNIPAGALALPALPDDSVDARMTTQGAQVRYLPDHPPLTKLSGSVRVTGQTLTAEAESAATLKQTNVSKARLYIADLNVDNPHIKLGFDAVSTGEDIAAFLALPRFSHMKQLNLANPSLEGAASGRVELEFDFFAPKDAQGKALESDIGYSIKGTVQGAAAKRFMNRFDVAQANGKMSVDNQEVRFDGRGQVNNVPMDVSVHYIDQPKDGMDTFVDFKVKSAPVEALQSFGVAKLDGFTGEVDAEGTVKSGDHKTEIEAQGNITAASIEITEVGLKKPLQVPATLTVHAIMEDNKPVEVKSFELSSESLHAKGSATIGDNFAKSGRVEFSELHNEKNNCALTYENKDGMRRLSLSGKLFDAGDLMKGNKDFSFKSFPATDFSADIERIVLGERRELRSVKGKLYCTALRCERADLGGIAGEKPFRFQITGAPGKRALAVRAEDAGAFLQALDLMDGIEGGALSLDGKYTERGDGSELNAVLRVRDYTVGNAPVLAKLLTLASLTGIVDTLQGKGIAFTKLVAPMIIADDVITIKDAKTHGSAMGMTAEGTIRFPGTIIDLKGTVVPSYSVNTVLGNVPIVGQVLTGGNKDSGIFAARYTITGRDGKPDVSVNPLSMLTPGFLRGLFDVFDAPKKEFRP